MKTQCSIAVLSTFILSVSAVSVSARDFEMMETKVSMERCLQAAFAKKTGQVVKLEFKNERGVPVYEFEIAGDDGKVWELECDANKGEITEEEQEVNSPDDPLFKTKMKINEEEARNIALKAHPGEIIIKTKEGKEIKMEVDAATGKIIENGEEEIYQIGKG